MLRRRILTILDSFVVLAGLALVARWLEASLFRFVSGLIGHTPSQRTALRLQGLGWILLVCGILGYGVIWYLLPHWGEISERLRQLGRAFDGWIEQHFSAVCQFQPALSSTQKPEKSINGWDVLVGVVFLLFSSGLLIGRLQGNFPFVFLGGDAANIASFAAAWDHPTLFQGDALLGDLNNIRIYSTIHIPLLRALAPIAGNYGLAMAILLAPHIFIQLIGFYLLGRVVFKSRYWAALLAVLTAMPFNLNLGEAWGIMPDALPRFTFQAILPYILTCAFLWRDKPTRWPWLMGMVGLMVYVHPVSTPAWMAAIWLSLWLFVPRDWSWKKKLGVMVGVGAVAVMVAMPFALNYLGNHEQGKSSNYSLVYHILKTYFPANLLDTKAAMREFGKILDQSWLLPGAIIGALVVIIFRRGDRKSVVQVLGWAAGIAIVSIFIPWGEQYIERTFHLVPVETELLRGIRYFIPLMMLFILWPLSELYRRLVHRGARLTVALIGLSLVGVWVGYHLPFPTYFENTAACLSSGKVICSQSTDIQTTVAAINAQVPEGATIFTSTAMDSAYSYGLVVRYLAIRPLVFSFKDRGLLGYSNEEGLTHWFEINQQMEKIQRDTEPNARLKPYTELAKQLGAQYILLNFQTDETQAASLSLQMIFQDGIHTLYRLPAPSTQ